MGWELINSKDLGMKTHSQHRIGENKASPSRRLYSGGLCGRSNGLAPGALYQISFGAEALHSFLTFTVGAAQPLCEASWLPVRAEAPAATLEKPDASDSH